MQQWQREAIRSHFTSLRKLSSIVNKYLNSNKTYPTPKIIGSLLGAMTTINEEILLLEKDIEEESK